MTRFLLLAFALLIALPLRAQTDASIIPDDAPEWLSMADAISQAQEEGKLIMVHTYATWCGWCAKLDNEVYSDDSVQAYMADNFTATRVDLEGTEVVPFFEHEVSMAGLGQAFGVSGTPTTVFVDTNGELITKLPGFADTETFLYALRFVRTGAYETSTFRQFMDAERGLAMPVLQQAVPDVRG
jgi:thioredoxin-related protein